MGALAAVELLEHLSFRSRRESRAPIANAHLYLARHGARADLDRRPGRSVLESIFDEVEYDLLDQDVIHGNERQVGGDFDRHGSTAHDRFESVERRSDEIFQRMPRPFHLERAGLEAGHGQEIRNQAVETAGFIRRRLEHLSPLRL